MQMSDDEDTLMQAQAIDYSGEWVANATDWAPKDAPESSDPWDVHDIVDFTAGGCMPTLALTSRGRRFPARRRVSATAPNPRV